ncbi:MAG: hypothetical protein HYR90_04820 [Candidatus Andersenbacteria bacterium]|nr:hypothetical protein [Candidatus Andersenbacteria bacterium]
MKKEVNIFGESRRANPTANELQPRPIGLDDLGRLIITPYQVRDLVSTAQAQTATLAEVTLLAGVAGTLLDLVYLSAANTSGAVVQLSIRDNVSGGVVETLQVPANNTIIFHPPVPIPQNEVANSWTIQNAGSGDISTTAVIVSALFIRNI